MEEFYVWDWEKAQDRYITLFDERELNGQPVQNGYVTSVSLSHDNKFAVSGYSNGSIKLWRLNPDVLNGSSKIAAPFQSLENSSDYIVSAHFSDDGPNSVEYTNALGQTFSWKFPYTGTPEMLEDPEKSIPSSVLNLLSLSCNHPELKQYLKEEIDFLDPIRIGAHEACEQYIWMPN